VVHSGCTPSVGQSVVYRSVLFSHNPWYTKPWPPELYRFTGADTDRHQRRGILFSTDVVLRGTTALRALNYSIRTLAVRTPTVQLSLRTPIRGTPLDVRHCKSAYRRLHATWYDTDHRQLTMEYTDVLHLRGSPKSDYYWLFWDKPSLVPHLQPPKRLSLYRFTPTRGTGYGCSDGGGSVWQSVVQRSIMNKLI